MMMQHTKQSAPTARRAGFTLAEVLISLGVFGIGMIAVASLFPVAAVLQKETADDILGTQSTLNARATLEAIGLTYRPGTVPVTDGDLDDYYTAFGPGTNSVLPVGTFLPNGFDGTSFYNRYHVRDRAYPTTEADAFARDHYWYFFARDLAGNSASPSWQGFVYLVDKEEDQTIANLEAGFRYADAGTLATPGDIELGTPYITEDGKTGTWNLTSTPAGFIYFHPQGIGVETFVFETLP